MNKKSKADYDVTIKEIENGSVYVIVRDNDLGNISVTNDMEMILLDLFELIPKLDETTIIYRDSQGIYDGVKLKDNGFEFYPIGEKSESRAIHKAEFFKNDY